MWIPFHSCRIQNLECFQSEDSSLSLTPENPQPLSLQVLLLLHSPLSFVSTETAFLSLARHQGWACAWDLAAGIKPPTDDPLFSAYRLEANHMVSRGQQNHKMQESVSLFSGKATKHLHLAIR